MRIGEFAGICGVPISVLRHYDKEGLLAPDYIDRFTGYRYYSAAQIAAFQKISTLKKAGFSLKEIKDILRGSENSQRVRESIAQKKAELQAMLCNLDSAEKILLGDETMNRSKWVQTEHGIEMRSMPLRLPLDPEDFTKACKQLERDAHAQNYQRISGFQTYGAPDSAEIQIGCEVIELGDEIQGIHENIDVPFENDEEVVGKWRVVGDFAVKDDFFADWSCKNTCYGDIRHDIYFLPGGERYWCYGWTKGFLIQMSGDGSCLNRYEIEEYNGEQYLFIEHKSYYYRRGGRPTVVVLRRIDRKAYTSREIAREDDIGLPFADDASVLGSWKAICYLASKAAFDPEQRMPEERLYFKNITFLKNGSCTSKYGDQEICGDHMQTWTKGFVLRKWNRTACAYEIRAEHGREYLLLEWKSGDYRWGGFDTDYYVFVRDDG